MIARYLPHIAPLLMLPALIGCGASDPAPPPLGQAALTAVVEQPGTGREGLARAVDALFSREDTAETRAVLVLKDGRIVAQR